MEIQLFVSLEGKGAKYVIIGIRGRQLDRVTAGDGGHLARLPSFLL